MRDHLVMAGLTIAARVLDELRRVRRPLDDDELASRLGVSPRQTINQVCRRLERSGRLRRYAGSEARSSMTSAAQVLPQTR
jgi:DNA-binding GntR family transcriptional regulator